MFHFVDEDPSQQATELTAEELVKQIADPLADPHEAAVVSTDPLSGHRLVRTLPRLERRVIAARMGGGAEQVSRDELAREFGVCTSEVAAAEERVGAHMHAVCDMAEAA